jgi:hypothetical protein
LNESRSAQAPRPQRFAAPWWLSGLLVLMLMLTAGLWWKERSARLAAGRAAAREDRPDALMELLRRAETPDPAAFEPLRREDLPGRPVELLGRRRTLYEISPEAGRRMGFRPGDVILVVEPPRASPDAASGPAYTPDGP